MSDENTTSSVPSPAESAMEVIDSVAPSPAEASALAATEGSGDKAAANAIKAAEKKLRTLKLKIDGEEEDLEFDPEDNDFLIKQFQMAKVGQKRMQEKSLLEKDVHEFFRQLKENPRAVLTDPSIGLDLKQLAAQIIEEEIENAKKSPEQLEKEQLQAELKAIKEEREREKEESKSRELKAREQQAAESYDIQFTKALEAGGLPKTPYVVKKMADYMYIGVQEGLDVTADDVLPLVKAEMEQDIKEMFATMPDELVEQMIGSKRLSDLRKKRVAAAKNPTAPPAPVNKSIPDTGGKKSEGKPKQKVNFKQFFGV